jgi:hypothetical protein
MTLSLHDADSLPMALRVMGWFTNQRELFRAVILTWIEYIASTTAIIFFIVIIASDSLRITDFVVAVSRHPQPPRGTMDRPFSFWGSRSVWGPLLPLLVITSI